MFVANSTAGDVVELPKTVNGYGTQVTLPFGGLSDPASVAVDAMGDVFVGDSSHDDVVELPKTQSGYGSQTTLPFTGVTGTGAEFGATVGLDSAGDVYATAGNIISDTHEVFELPKTQSGYGTQQTITFTSSDGLDGMAVDAAGDVFATPFNEGVPGSVEEAPASDGGHSAAQTLPFTGLNESQNLSVDANGNVFAEDNGNDDIVLLPKTESGYGPQQTLPFMDANSVMASDSAGDLFVGGNGADVSGNTNVIEYLKDGSAYTPSILPFTDLGYGIGSIAVDRSGDVFVTALNQGGDEVLTVLELPKTAEGYGTQTTVPFTGLSNAGLLYPGQLTTDAAGDVYVINDGGGEVLEVPKTADGFGSQVTLPFSGSLNLDTIATDGNGDVFAVNDSSVMLELPKTAGGYGTEVSTELYTLNVANVDSMTMDANGDAFLIDGTGNGEHELPNVDGTFGTAVALPFTSEGLSIAIDSTGDVYVGYSPETPSYGLPGIQESQVAGAIPPPTPGPYSPLTPTRICDTRAGNPSGLSGNAAQCNGVSNTGTRIAAGGTLNITAGGEFSVPDDASAVVLNVTAVQPSAAGHLTVYPAGETVPTASNLQLRRQARTCPTSSKWVWGTRARSACTRCLPLMWQWTSRATWLPRPRSALGAASTTPWRPRHGSVTQDRGTPPRSAAGPPSAMVRATPARHSQPRAPWRSR